ncbi:hypothetical protein L6164_015226 [Bauhinia variegata]|uniref:Uncharacterized protein n=1 Tax=Bauhinia variegata TaxID=167791 RepID=A0ACB9NKN2_BAUVA|nr:hypothetical protein L6164_015226 [Bauhinia variegata]
MLLALTDDSTPTDLSVFRHKNVERCNGLGERSLRPRLDVEEGGGETVFPAAKTNFSSVPWFNKSSECCRKVLPVKLKMSDALLFIDSAIFLNWKDVLIWNEISLEHETRSHARPFKMVAQLLEEAKSSSKKWMRLEEYQV